MARFDLSQRLVPTTRQELTLQPRMLQSIEVLQLPALELETWLRQAVEENEALTLEEPPPAERAPADQRRAGREETERHDRMLQNQPGRARSLVERVEEQLALIDPPPDLEAWLRFLVRCLDENGFLSTPPERLLELARDEGLSGDAAQLERGISALQGLEPRGIGARNAIEALLLQVDEDDPDYGEMRWLLTEFLEDVARNKMPRVARAMGLEVPRLQELIERLRGLNPRPASQLVEVGAPCITPDVVVERSEGGFDVAVSGAALPSVRIEPEVATLARDRDQPREVRKYLRGKLDRARWVVDAVEQRRRTLLRIAAAVFDRQREFLEHGAGHLRPLRMNEMAGDLELHVSTVSRAVAGKYAQTPWGILPLRHFFQSSAGSDGESSRTDVQAAVGEILAAEDRRHPLSDDEVVEELARRGWRLARRTVAKYRSELGIPSSYRRRTYGS